MGPRGPCPQGFGENLRPKMFSGHGRTGRHDGAEKPVCLPDAFPVARKAEIIGRAGSAGKACV